MKTIGSKRPSGFGIVALGLMNSGIPYTLGLRTPTKVATTGTKLAVSAVPSGLLPVVAGRTKPGDVKAFERFNSVV